MYMKTCLSSRCEHRYLKAAKEIKVAWRDRKIIPELAEKYPETTIILQLIGAEEIDWVEIKDYNNLCKGNLICAAAYIHELFECASHNIRYYYGFPINTFSELQALKNIGVCYVRLGEGLFFHMPKVKDIGVPVRIVPNVAYTDGIPRDNGIAGHWVRPEDMLLYQDYVETIEFEDAGVKKEQALFRIYTSQEGWYGDINDLITNLNYSASNKMLPNNITMERIHCGQQCKINGRCQVCFRAFDLAQPDKIKEYFKEYPEALQQLRDLQAQEEKHS